jgi:two-component SAPR family response regulator
MQAKILVKTLASLEIDNVEVFATLSEITEALQQGQPRVVISAMHLDDGTGADLVGHLRKHPQTRSVACFLVSSDAVTETGSNDRDRLMILPKPLTRDMLARALEGISRP